MRRVELENLIELTGGGTPSKKKPEYWDGDIPWASVKDLKTSVLTETVDKITKEGLENSSSKLVEKGNLIIATRMAVGKAVMTDIDVAINQDLKAVYTSDKINNKYLQYFFASKSDYFERTGKGATVKGIKTGDILSLKIPLPSLSEQKAIVSKLDRAQRLIDIDKEMLAKYDELIQSVFLEMFGDPVMNSKGWDRVVFSKVFDITTGKLNANAAVEGGEYPFFTCSREISWIDNYAFDTEALLLAGNNASGDFNIKHYKGKFNAYQRTYVLTSEENYGFLKIALDYFLNQMKSDSIGTNTKYLTLKLLDRINIPIPPIDLQKKFNGIVSKIDEEKRIINQQQIKKSEELFSSLVQGAFG